MTTAIQEYSATEAALAGLAQRYKGVLFDVTTLEGMATARKGRAEIRTYRTTLEKKRVQLKSDVLDRGRLIDGEAKRITAELESLENPIDEQIKKEEQRVEDIRTAKAREEAARIAAEEQARKEAEESRMAAERAEIAMRQAELYRAERERREADERSRLKLEEEAREARRKIEEEERQARLAREQADREARQAREAEEARMAQQRRDEEAVLAAERRRLEDERRAVEEAQRKEREAEERRQKALRDEQEAKEREARRIENERLDGRTMLITFRDQFGKIEEFAPVVAAINKYLKELKKGSA